MLDLLIDLVAALYPPLYALLLGVGTVLFGFCSYVFFDYANVVGGVIFLLLALLTLALLVHSARQGRFEGKRSGKNKKQ